jgi:hypothetical protein
MIRTTPQSIQEIFADGKAIDEALRRAVREALVRHKRLGEEVVVWRDGKVVCLSGDQIPETLAAPPTGRDER